MAEWDIVEIQRRGGIRVTSVTEKCGENRNTQMCGVNPQDFPLCGVATLGVTMILEWDEAKNRTNIRKHGFHLSEATVMFGGRFLARPDTREDYGEKRWIGTGMIRGRVAFVAFAELPEDRIRIIFVEKGNA